MKKLFHVLKNVFCKIKTNLKLFVDWLIYCFCNFLAIKRKYECQIFPSTFMLL